MSDGPKLAYTSLAQYCNARGLPFLCICARPWGVPIRVRTSSPWYTTSANDSRYLPEDPTAA